MCNAKNHPADCRCGWGGEGHLGKREAKWNDTWQDNLPSTPWHTSDSDFCRIAKRPICFKPVYFVRHNGGSVWFDELGKPWPKHPCFDVNNDIATANTAPKTSGAPDAGFEKMLNSSVGAPAPIRPSRYFAGFIVGIVGRSAFAWPVSAAGLAQGVTMPAVPRKGNGECPFIETGGGTAQPYYLTASTVGGIKAEARALFAKAKGHLHPRFGVTLRLYDSEKDVDLPGIVLRDPRQVSAGYFQPRPYESVATIADGGERPAIPAPPKKLPAVMEG